MPENAVRYPNWWMRGGYEDVFPLDFGEWRFPLGTASVSSLWVYIWGNARSCLRGGYGIAAVGAPMSAVPQFSQFWHSDGTNGSKILTWHNFFVGRVPISELDGSESDFSRVERVDRVEGDELDFNTETQRHREKSSFVPQSLCASVLRNLENNLHVSTRSTRLNNSVCSVSSVVKNITQTAQSILDARALYPDSSLADLYDPLTMPIELRKAHAANDAAVMKAYGYSPSMTEPEIVADLMTRYQKLTMTNS
jgi:hypothetical protein